MANTRGLSLSVGSWLSGFPQGSGGDDGWGITDRYIIDTRLRLRRMEPLDGGETVFKLG